MALKPASSVILFATALFAQTFDKGPARSPHGPLTIACASCHTATSWRPLRAMPEFDHNRETRFPLRGLHENVECRLCHTRPVFANTGSKCADCHADIHRRQFGARCDECHTVKGWNVMLKSVAGHQNRFPLFGGHAAVECEACHKGAAAARFTGLNTACSSCHMREFQAARVVDHRAAGFPTTCEQCHGLDSWRASRFDHGRFANFPLAGAHASLECSSCHTGGRFTPLAADCYSCHSREFNSVQDPNHVRAAFPKDCAQCHTATAWTGGRFDHAAFAKFALTGAHAKLACSQCHANNSFTGTASQCAGCHLADYQKAANPNHAAAGFSQDCSVCHSTAQWQGAQFNHANTKFPLTGAHVKVDCAQCHAGNKFAGLASDCASCHLSDFQKTTNPNHAAAGFPQDCTLCHTTAQWQGAQFDHARTKFPLTGAHVKVDCAQCHVGGRFTGLASGCASCHLADFQKTTNPNHVTAGFPQDCSVCHTTAQWQGAQFDHGRTKFPLTGAHVKVECAQCHVGGKFSGLAAECSSCHLADFQKTSNPNHASAGFPQDCAMCHTTAQWQGARFDHANTKFPLTGAHVQVACAQCHVGNKFAGLAADCASCHLGDFQKTTNPNHAAAGFPQDCTVCHTTAQWQGAKFDHSKTQFALTGAHAAVQCAACHVGGKFAGLNAACVSCHLTKFTATTNPNHAQAGFPQQCEVCHTTSAWTPASFNHSATRFPLTGAHTKVACANCHIGGRYTGTPADCYSCHTKEFQTVSNPNHIAANFPHDCGTCHNTSTWTGAQFNHAQFPIYSGRHRPPTWTTCNDCHNNPSNYTVFVCTNCHAHDKASTDAHHREVRNYVYNSANCYACHPTGRGD